MEERRSGMWEAGPSGQKLEKLAEVTVGTELACLWGMELGTVKSTKNLRGSVNAVEETGRNTPE